MHAAIENNTLMMETFTGKPVSRYAVVTARDILVPILKFLIGNLPFMTEQACYSTSYSTSYCMHDYLIEDLVPNVFSSCWGGEMKDPGN